MYKGLFTPNDRLTLWQALTHDKDCHLNLFTSWISYLTYNSCCNSIFVHIMCEWLHIPFDVLTLLIKFHGDNKYVVTILMLTSFCTRIIFSNFLLVDFFFNAHVISCFFSMHMSFLVFFNLQYLQTIVYFHYCGVFFCCVSFVMASTFVYRIAYATSPSFSSFAFCFEFNFFFSYFFCIFILVKSFCVLCHLVYILHEAT